MFEQLRIPLLTIAFVKVTLKTIQKCDFFIYLILTAFVDTQS